VGRKRIPTSPASPFYGYPAEVIAEWCGVSVATAKHYKAGSRRPPTPVIRLFRLYRDQKVLGKDWDGHKVQGPKLFGPDGKSITASHIVLQSLLWQALADSNQEKYFQLLRVAAQSQSDI